MRFLLAFFCLPTLLSAQIGGNYTYQFLQLSPSARVTALGGNLIMQRDKDVSLFYANPALLSPLMHGRIAFSQDIHPAGIGFGNLAYAHNIEKWGTTLGGSVQYIGYGKIRQTNEEGDQTGEFRANEYALTLGAGKQVSEQLSIGANLKTVLSYLAPGYNSMGLALDLGANYLDTAKNISVSLVFRNIGTQLRTYNRAQAGLRELLPFDIQLGFSHRLRYLPLRFGIVAHQLQRWNLRYADPALLDAQNLFSDPNAQPEERTFANGVDNFFRHFIFNLELLLGKSELIRLRLGYNHLRGAELRVQNLRSLAGFTGGVGLNLRKFSLDYGFGSYHFAGTAHHFTLSVNLMQLVQGGK